MGHCIAEIANKAFPAESIRCGKVTSKDTLFCDDCGAGQHVIQTTAPAKLMKYRNCDVTGCKKAAVDGFRCAEHDGLVRPWKT